VDAIDNKLEDDEWVQALIKNAVGSANHFSDFYQIARLAAGRRNQEKGQALAREVLDSAAQGILNKSGPDNSTSGTNSGTADLIKLARSASTIVGDRAWAVELLNSARERAAGYLDLSALGKALFDAGDTEGAGALFHQAAQTCGSAATLLKLIMRLKGYGIKHEALQQIYQDAQPVFTDRPSKLAWAEGLVDQFGELDLARKAYNELAPEFDGKPEQGAFQASLKARIRPGHEYTRPQRSVSWS
jgi:hypothetical protein